MSAERLVPQPSVIEPLSEGKVTVPYPGEIPIETLMGILAESIFLTSKKVRITSQYEDFTDEITPQEIDDARNCWPAEEVAYFIDDKARGMAWADKIVIETLDESMK
ncbi:hypothetical protein M1615_02510 [Patescibacteria group bacterium]|nr:hypothetical protein [Patescibacteria group bacterium]